MKQLVFFTTFCHESWYSIGTCWVPLHIWSQVSGLSIRRGAAFSHSEWHPIHNHPPHEILRENIQMCSSCQIVVTKIKWRTGRRTEHFTGWLSDKYNNDLPNGITMPCVNKELPWKGTDLECSWRYKDMLKTTCVIFRVGPLLHHKTKRKPFAQLFEIILKDTYTPGPFNA